MNYLKLQNELLKAANKRDGWKHVSSPYMYEIVNENVCVTDGGAVWIIPEKCFYLDVNKVFKKEPLHLVKQMMDADVEDAKMTTELKRIGERVLVKFILGDKSIWIDEKLLKLFDLKNSHFRSAGSKSPLHIYEDETLVGIVLPVYLKEGEHDA